MELEYKKYYCQYCNKEIKRACSLAIHERVCKFNPNRKPLENIVCNWPARDKKNGGWKCRFCECIFETRKEKQEHIKLNHSEQIIHSAWNSGLTKENNKIIAKMAEKISNNYKKGIVKEYDHKIIWTEEKRKQLSDDKKAFYLKHPEKHPNALVAGILNKMTYPEKIVANYLKEHNIIAEHNWYFKTEKFTRYIDFYIDELKLFIEVDGEYWHKDKQKDIDKDNDAIIYGYKTLRLKPKTVITQLDEFFNNLKN